MDRLKVRSSTIDSAIYSNRSRHSVADKIIYHPADDPSFHPLGPVYYLSHPLAPDEYYTFEQNMAHVLHMLRLCLDEGVRAIAPYHTHCLVLDDSNHAHRKLGLETDCAVVHRIGDMLMVGHKVSRGMLEEAKYASSYIDLTGYKDSVVREKLQLLRAFGKV
jgi:hypothetical protein